MEMYVKRHVVWTFILHHVHLHRLAMTFKPPSGEDSNADYLFTTAVGGIYFVFEFDVLEAQKWASVRI